MKAYLFVIALLFIECSKSRPPHSQIRFFCELQVPCVPEKVCKYIWQPFAQCANRHVDLHVPHHAVWFVKVRRGDMFPGQFAPQKANENVGDGFQVVPAALLLAEEVVNRGVPGGASSGGGTALGVVFQCVRIAVPSGHAEVYEVNGVGVMPPDDKVTLENVLVSIVRRRSDD